MPLVKIEIFKGKTAEYRKAILDGVHSAPESSAVSFTVLSCVFTPKILYYLQNFTCRCKCGFFN